MTRIVLPPRLSLESLEALEAELHGSAGVHVLVGADGFCSGMDLARAIEGDPAPALRRFTQTSLIRPFCQSVNRLTL